MATRRMGGVRGWAAALAVAALATGTWAAAQDSGNGAAANGADSAAPATQQSQDQRQGPGRAFDARRFDRDGPQRFRDARHHWHRDWRRHRDWDRWHGQGRGRAGGFARARMRRGAALAGMRLDAPMLGAFRQLNLSDAQRQSVRAILTNARSSARQSARQARGNRAGAAGATGAAGDRQQLAALLNPGDPDHARAVEAVKSRAVDRIQRATQTQQALYNVLTPAQKMQLTQIFAQRRARMQQRGLPGLRG